MSETDTMPIEDYLAQGGVLTSPANVPARYRGELLRLMATFVDSELAGSAGFADAINAAPSITARIAAARITLEKVDHAERVLRRWADWAPEAPESATTSLRFLNLPPLPAIPAPLRGRSVVAIDGAVLGCDAQARSILGLLRDLGPEIDTFGRVPARSLTRSG